MGGLMDLYSSIPHPLGESLFGKPKSPKLPEVTPPPKVDPKKVAANSKAAKKKKNQDALSAYGQMDTNLTGSGLGALAPVNKQYSSLLGAA